MLLDTSGLFCLLHRRERAHEQTCELYRRAAIRVTHNYVLAELIALASARGVPQGSVISFVRDLLTNPQIDVVWADEALTSRPLSLLVSRQDRSYSLADAVSFVLMRERGIEETLTTDRHFESEGFRRLLP